MCGIAGVATRDQSLPSEGMLQRMSAALSHRGPDGEGIWRSPGIGLAHRRLAIIDLSPAASQPMSDTSGTFFIIFNGEIYNYRELRQELAERQTTFRTQSDTEVILEAYRAWNISAFTRLRGMFAFAIWDASARRLILARDKIGKKPLFYGFTSSGHLAFASELKAIHSVCSLKPDWQAIRLFLGLQYVPSPLTGFEGVKQLLPGEVGIFDQQGWRTEMYHTWTDNRQQTTNNSGQIRQLLDDAVKVRVLASDVPVGAFLSGGIDSAAVVAFASKCSPRPLETFTMGFPSLAMDERREAREVAQFFGTDHQEFEARPEQLSEILDELISHYDAPYADSSALPLWLLARETAKEIKVVLTGDGGDELFGGYRRYAWYELALLLAKIPLAIPDFCLDRFPPHWIRLFETIGAAREDPARAYGELFCGAYFNTRMLQEMFDPLFLAETSSSDSVNYMTHKIKSVWARHVGARHALPLHAAMHFDLTSYLPDDLNVKMDRATMRFGLEARSPFLDADLVSYAIQMPLTSKIHGGKKKIALKKALVGFVPENVLRRQKRGFQVPLAEWFRGPLRNLFQERCVDPSLQINRLMQRGAVRTLLRENDAGRDHGNRLWMLLTLSTWLSRFAA